MSSNIASFISLLEITRSVLSSIAFAPFADFCKQGNRAIHGGSEKLNKDPHFRDYVPFHGTSSSQRFDCHADSDFATEFFHADSGKGLGASHQSTC